MSHDAIDMQMLDLFEKEFQLCKVKAGEVLVVLSATGEWPEYVKTFILAAQRMGASAFHLSVPRTQAKAAAVQGRHPVSGNQAAIDTLKRADMVVDLMGLLFSAEQREIQAAGTRILRVMEPLHVLEQMFPTEDLRRRVDYAQSLLAKARVLRITSAAGTDVRYELSQYEAISEYGYTDEAGRWDHFPSGFVFTQGNDGGVNGTVMLMPGDIIAAFKRYVETPVKFRIENGYIVEISGAGTDAAMIREYIESFRDPRAYAVAHIGWGLNERANWHHMAATRHLDQEHVMHALSFYGNVLFSTGPNSEFGGDNDTPCHMDLPMRQCSVWVDEVQVMEAGVIVHPEMRAAGR